MSDHFSSAQRGALFGAWAGDTIGSYLEFSRSPRAEQVDRALQLPGGGPHGLQPGQLTDDGELIVCLANSLHKGQDALSLYRRWADSNPVDIGHATASALIDLEPLPQTKANGSLMRCPAFAVLPPCPRRSKAELTQLIKLVRRDCRHTHPHPTVVHCCVAYVLILRALIDHPESPERAGRGLELAACYLRRYGNEEARRLFELSEPLPATPQEGFIGIALSLALYHLRAQGPLPTRQEDQASRWQHALRDVLSRGGDTDTNACIVMGLLGALYGIGAVPPEVVAAITSCRARPFWLRPTTL